MKMNNKFQNQQGQNMIEYMLLFVAVTLVMLAFLANGGAFHQKLDQVFNDTVNGINSMSDEMKY